MGNLTHGSAGPHRDRGERLRAGDGHPRSGGTISPGSDDGTKGRARVARNLESSVADFFPSLASRGAFTGAFTGASQALNALADAAHDAFDAALRVEVAPRSLADPLRGDGTDPILVLVELTE